MDEFIGRSVKITLEDGDVYDGFVHSYSSSSRKLSLEKVTFYDNGEKKKLVGLLHFFGEEITNIVATEEVRKTKSKKHAVETNRSRGQGIMKNKYQPAHLNRLDFLEPSSLVLKNKKLDDDTTSSSNDDSDLEIDNMVHQDYSILAKMDNVFHDAISHIKKYHVVGMSLEGVSIGRSGKLSWLLISVPDHVFMFDVLRLGPACFTEGLKAIIENEEILKVLHDCRLVADILYHVYTVNLVNVFDTQVANVFVFRLKHHGDWPRYVEGLAPSLVQHLNLSPEEINWSVVRERYKETDEEVWLRRPIQSHLVEAAVKNVKHLLELRQVLMEKMLEEFVAGVNIYLMHVKDASESDAHKYKGMSHLLPMAFEDIRRFMGSYSGRNPYNKTTREKVDDKGFRENCSGIAQPNVHFSRDSLWHAGSRVSQARYASQVPEKTKEQPETKPENAVTNSTTQPTSQETKTDTPVFKPTPRESQEAPSTIPETEQNVKPNDNLPNWRHTPTTATDDLLKQTVDQMNAASRLQHVESNHQSSHATSSAPSHTASSAPSQAPSVASVTDTKNIYPDSDTDLSELSGGSLMRALVNTQDQSGNEWRRDIDNFQIRPAGKTPNITKNVYKRPSQKLLVSLEDLDKPLPIREPTVRPGLSKQLTPQELEMARMCYGNTDGGASNAGQTTNPSHSASNVYYSNTGQNSSLNRGAINGQTYQISQNSDAVHNGQNGSYSGNLNSGQGFQINGSLEINRDLTNGYSSERTTSNYPAGSGQRTAGHNGRDTPQHVDNQPAGHLNASNQPISKSEKVINDRKTLLNLVSKQKLAQSRHGFQPS